MARTSPVLHVVPPGEDPVLTLAACVAAARGGDPLQPVTVAAPSNVAGLHLRRRLSLEGSGFANVRFMPLARIAELIGAPLLAHQNLRRLTAWNRYAAVAAALADAPGTLAPVASHPATVQAVSDTLIDLRRAHEGAVALLDDGGELATALGVLHRRVRDLTADFYDDQDIFDAAANAVAAEPCPALNDVGQVICYLPLQLLPAEVRFLRALAASVVVQVIVQPTGETKLDEELSNMISNLGDETSAARVCEFEPAPPPETSIAIALDLEEEARLIVREIVRAARAGVPLHRVAVIANAPEHGPLLREQLRAAGIDCNGVPERSLARSVAGRTLLGFFSLEDDDFRRDAVMRWLSQAPILEYASGDDRWRRVPLAQWERIAREASVVRGIGQWRKRLEAALSGGSSRRPMPDWQADFAGRLLAFVNELHDSVQPLRTSTAAGLAAHCEQLLERYLGSQNTVEKWETPARTGGGDSGIPVKDSEVEAYRLIVRLLREMQSGDAPADPFASLPAVDAWRAFGAALKALLDRSGPTAGRFGNGVFLGSLESARALDFDLVFIAGMTEGAMPSIGHEDPLLNDEERDAIQVPTRSSRRLLERAAYLGVRSAAPRVMLSAPRSSLRGQGKLGPSRWLLAEVERLLARDNAPASRQPMSPDRLEALTLAPEHERPAWLLAPASFEAALGAHTLEPASEQEYLLRSLRFSTGMPSQHFLGDAELAYRAGLQSATGRLPRWRRRELVGELLDVFSGAIGPDSRLAPWLGTAEGASPVSPTSLEDFATCPYRYFLRHVLRVEETEEPEERLTLEAAERGNIIHEALEAFFAEVRPAADRLWTGADREALRALGEDKCRERETHGLTGAAISWESMRHQILRDLDLFLDADELARRSMDASFSRAEAAFGLGGEWSPAAYRLPDGRAIRFHGKVDRVDISAGQHIVYDYKSGKSDDFKTLADDPVARGKKLQLAIYGLAVRAAFGLGPDSAVSAYYWFVNENERFRRIGYEVDEARLERFSEALQAIVGGIERGLFPQVPGKPGNGRPENCGYCPYRTACPGDPTEGWEERRGDGRLAGLLALIEPGNAPEQTEAGEEQE